MWHIQYQTGITWANNCSTSNIYTKYLFTHLNRKSFIFTQRIYSESFSYFVCLLLLCWNLVSSTAGGSSGEWCVHVGYFVYYRKHSDSKSSFFLLSSVVYAVILNTIFFNSASSMSTLSSFYSLYFIIPNAFL